MSIKSLILNHIKYKLMPDSMFIRRQYKKKFGYDMDFSNPQTLSEKIQVLKLYDRRDLHTICADKLMVREYVKNKIGEHVLIPLICSLDSVDELFFDKLPEYPFVIKCNHNSGGVFIVRDKNKIDFDKIKYTIGKELEKNYYYESKEWQYKNIKPKIVIEKLLLDEKCNIPADIKVHCFNGQPQFMQIDTGRFTEHKRSFYDFNWDVLPFRWSAKDESKGISLLETDEKIEKIPNLDIIREYASKLAIDFPYVRVDFYVVKNEIYFGEITFHHGGGFEIFEPECWDFKLGQKLNINSVLNFK